MIVTHHITKAVGSLDDALVSLRDADAHDEAPAPFLALCSVRIRDLRDVLTEWEVQ